MKVQVKTEWTHPQNKHLTNLGRGFFFGHETWNSLFGDDGDTTRTDYKVTPGNNPQLTQPHFGLDFIALEHDTVVFSIQRKEFKEHASRAMWHALIKHGINRVHYYMQATAERIKTNNKENSFDDEDDFFTNDKQPDGGSIDQQQQKKKNSLMGK